LLFRDGRPFADELGAQRADSLPVPYPGVVAGAVRTAIGNALGWDWKNGRPARARSLNVQGPVVCIGDGKPVVGAPADAVIYGKENDTSNPAQCMCLRPFKELPNGWGCTMPEGLQPMQVTNEGKPEAGYVFWPWHRVMEWLGSPQGAGFQVTDDLKIGRPALEERTHVRIGANDIAEEGMLFTTASVVPLERSWGKPEGKVERDWSYLVRVASNVDIEGPLFLGGERRIAVAEKAGDAAWPKCPDELAAKLKSAKRVRMLLVTPAIFSGGWMPGWVGGSPPGMENLQLNLISACVPRREAVSGWDYAKRVPKAVRWLVPAGSVFFFEAEGDTSQLASSAWLAPVSDDEQDRRDGYGLAVWGVWDYHQAKEGGNG